MMVVQSAQDITHHPCALVLVTKYKSKRNFESGIIVFQILAQILYVGLDPIDYMIIS